MRIWQLGIIEGLAWTEAEGWDIDDTHALKGIKRADDWQEIEIFDLEGFNYSHDADITTFYGGLHFVLDQKAKDAVSALVGQEAEFLPVRYRGERHWILNVLCELDCLDFEASVVKRFSTGRFMRPEAYWFDEEAVGDHRIFQVAGIPRSEFFVTDAFKEGVAEAGVTGFGYTLLWDSDFEEPLMYPESPQNCERFPA